MSSRKRKRPQYKPAKKVFIDLEEASEDKQLTNFTDVVKTFSLQYNELSWNLTSPFDHRFYDDELPLKFVNSLEDAKINSFGEEGDESYLLIGHMTILGNMAGISNILKSIEEERQRKATLHWLSNGTQCISVLVHLPSSVEPILLYCPVVIVPSINSSIVQELSCLCKRSAVQLITSYPKIDSESSDLFVSVLAGKKLINEDNPDSLHTVSKSTALRPHVINLFHEDICTGLDSHSEVILSGENENEKPASMKYRIFQFYRWVRTHQLKILPLSMPPLPSEIPLLTANLHQYQCKAVQWMLSKERATGWAQDQARDDKKLHLLWKEINMDDVSSIYYNPYTGRLSPIRYTSPVPPKGGILADEMGLGKTVEILALILIHRWPGWKDMNENRGFREEDVNQGMESVMMEGNHSTALEDINDNEVLLEEQEIDLGLELPHHHDNKESRMESQNDKRIEKSIRPIQTLNRDNALSGEKRKEIELEQVQLDTTQEEQSNVKCGEDHETEHVCYDSVKQVDHHDKEVEETMEELQTQSTTLYETTDMETLENDVGTKPGEIEKKGEESDSDEIWCICGGNNSDDYEGEVVQCEQCLVWQHSKCADYDGSKTNTFVCVRCLLKQPISCGTTLVIVPETLLHQWLEEIAKHTEIESLRVMVYWGVSHRYLNPLHIISHDIVLVTYEILRKELDRVHHHEFTLMLRKRKRSAYPPSPLLAINWWRICLDEAQTVESITAKPAEMTRKLTAVNRWCVTGTPVQRDLRDLYGLLYFLEVRPHCINHWWTTLVWQPYHRGNPCPMVALFANLMWRNSKEDVADELCLPEMREKIHWLTFSAVEAYFYCRQQEICYSTFSNVVQDIAEKDVVLSELHRSLITKLLTPLHTLRQACCHPQLVRRGYVALNPRKKSYLTMNDLLKKLITQAKQEGRENLRVLVAALNGQAAIHILTKKWQEAVDAYREAMQSWKNHEKNFDCDKLQKIHTMENLAYLLKRGHSSHSRALSDDQLEVQATELRSQYMNKHESQVKAAVQSLSVAADHVRQSKHKAYHSQAVYLGEAEEEEEAISPGVSDLPVIEDEKNEEEGSDEEDNVINHKEMKEVQHFKVDVSSKPPSQPWWLSVITWTKECSRDTELLSVLETELHSSPDFFNHLTFFSFKDLTGLQYTLVNHIDKLETQRSEVLIQVDALSKPGPLSPTLIAAATQCHLKTNRINPSSICDYCEAETAIKTYENLLFSRYLIGTEESDTSRSMSVCERLLKCILSFIKSKRASLQLCMAGKQLSVYLEVMRKEFKHILALWIAAEQRVRACDELSMAARRFRLLEDDGYMYGSGVDDPFVLTQTDLFSSKLQFISDQRMSKAGLRKSLGQLTYLHNLVRAQGEDGEDSVSCPICSIELKEQWAVFPCGHCFCMECLYTLTRQHRPFMSHQYPHHLRLSQGVTFDCPMCRERLSSNEINYIKTASNTEKDIQLKGSYSTKITAITAQLLKIKLQEPDAKSLVFSSNSEVLKLIAHALKENDIQHAFLQHKNHFQLNLDTFKTSSTLNVLLIPMSSGSKGLNITEATHVLLVEPSLNIGSELQAIGRVHRVGQTKDTTVHRFYVRDSIEERIKEMLSSSADVAKFITTSNTSESDCSLTVSELQSLITRP